MPFIEEQMVSSQYMFYTTCLFLCKFLLLVGESQTMMNHQVQVKD